MSSSRKDLIRRALARYKAGKGGAATLKRIGGTPNLPQGWEAAGDLTARRQILQARAVQRVRAGKGGAATTRRLSSKGVDSTGLAKALSPAQYDSVLTTARASKSRVRSKSQTYQGL